MKLVRKKSAFCCYEEMKTLYITAWTCLILSIAVHVTSILGPKDILSNLDGFIWMLHGGVILLGGVAIFIYQRTDILTQKKDSKETFFNQCPLWMRRMVVLLVLYGIINFIFFIFNGLTANGGETPASVFKYFSGHWMIGYSVETAFFYSCMKANVRIPRINWSKSLKHIVIFFIVFGIFLFLLWLAFKGYPWFLGITLFSLFPFVIINVMYMAYTGWKNDRYLKKNYFEIWEKSRSPHFSERAESRKMLKELNDPYLKSLSAKLTRFSTISFYVWLVFIGLILIGLFLLQN